MGRDTTKASDHKSTNALDDVDTGGVEVKFSFGSRNIRVERIPEMGDVFAITLKVQVNGDGNKKNAKGELYPRRDLTIIEGWPEGKKPPAKNENQGELYPTDPVTGGPEVEDGSVDTGGDED
ncbi:hypothetical protein H7J86_26115 [Mycobacterium hackensackense]|uniref:hypothetical protein n=1 Tax=Mycobacterium hackensackense TaxID=228909 RepID=UPI0022659A46|nr:hypothetical protein [Mycobacterium hackensackense]MCV7255644.1 hypothetical protein [Mycobacterium hackensackense]